MFHQGPIAGIAATGPFIATAGYDNRVILWDAASKRPLARGMHDHLVNHCAFSGDGRLIVSASSDYSARIWDVPSMHLKAALTGHEDDVDMAVFSPDDTLVATCALDRKIRVFDLTGRCLKTICGHTGNILAVTWTSDGERLVSSGVDGTVREWDAGTGAELRCNQMDVRTDTLAIGADGRIVAGDDKGRIAIIIDGQISFIQAHNAGIKAIEWDEPAGILITLSYDRTIAVWHLTGASSVEHVARTGLPAMAWARAAVSIGEGRLAVGTFGSSFAVFDWRKNTWDLSGIVIGNALNAVVVTQGARYAIGDAGTLMRDGQPSTRLNSLCNFLLPADGRLLTGGQLGQLFDAHSGQMLYQHHSPLNCGAVFHRDGKAHAAIGTYTGEALIFVLDGDGPPTLLTSLKLYDSAIKGLVANADRIFSVCASTTVSWHTVDDFRLIRTIPNAHGRIANGCCLAGPDGFASVGRDLMLRIWTGAQEEAYRTPHPNSVKCICASDDGGTLMTGAYTGTVAGFDMSTRRWVSFSRPTSSGVSALAYDPVTRHFVASSYDGRIYSVA